MRKLVSGFAASLDGYIEGPSGEYDWILIDKDINFAEQARRFGAYFYGRKTYEKMLPYGNQPTPGIDHYVFSSTLTSVAKNFQLVRDPVKKKVEELKSMEGKDIAVFGGASLLASLLDLQLIDELSVAVIPVLLGKGKPMVDVLQEKAWLALQNTRTYGNGTVQLTYDVIYKKPKNQ